MHSAGRPTGDADGDMRRAVQLHSCQTLTPESETSTHYFFQQSPRSATPTDPAVIEGIFQSLVGAFNEDRDMITAQHRSITLDPSRPMLPLAMDAALTQFRRLVALAVEAERAAARA